MKVAGLSPATAAAISVNRRVLLEDPAGAVEGALYFGRAIGALTTAHDEKSPIREGSDHLGSIRGGRKAWPVGLPRQSVPPASLL